MSAWHFLSGIRCLRCVSTGGRVSERCARLHGYRETMARLGPAQHFSGDSLKILKASILASHALVSFVQNTGPTESDFGGVGLFF